MTIENTPATGTAEVSQEESYEAYEQRYKAEGSGSDTAEPSDVDEPVEDSDDKTASESETEDDTEQEDEDENEGEKPKRSKGGFQRKIDKLTATIHELKAQLAKPAGAAQEGSEKAAEPPATPQFETAKPKMEDFDSIEDFTEALTDWKLSKKDFEREQAAKQEAAKKEAEALIDGWNARVSDAKKVHPDYDSVMQRASDIKISPAHQRLFLESDTGAQIAYQLASDKAELQKFAEMSPLAAARYFGKLEAASSDTPAQKKPPASTRAPRPPATVSNRGGSVDTAPSDSDDYSAWEAKRNAQLRKRR